MENYKNRCRQVVWQSANHSHKGFYSSSRSSHNDNIMSRHIPSAEQGYRYHDRLFPNVENISGREGHPLLHLQLEHVVVCRLVSRMPNYPVKVTWNVTPTGF